MLGWLIAFFIVYWQWMLAYISGGALYSVIKWTLQVYRLRNRVLGIDVAKAEAEKYEHQSLENVLKDIKRSLASEVGFRGGTYPPLVKNNKSTLFWWAVIWPLNLIWTLVADVAKEAWDWMYRKFGALYDKITKSILPE